MKTIENSISKITWDDAKMSFQTGGMPSDALASSIQNEKRIWEQAIDQMLCWKSDPSQFADEDRPDDDILETAIDFAVDESEDEPAPCSIIPSGSGRIAMEWNDGSKTVVIEFVALGQANYIEFTEEILQAKYMLTRDPKSRKLERRG